MQSFGASRAEPDVRGEGIPIEPEVLHVTTVHARHDTRIWLKECLTLMRSGFRTGLIVADGLGDSPAATESDVPILDIGALSRRRLVRFGQSVIRTMRLPWKYPSVKVFHFHDPELMLAGIVWRLAGRKVIYDVHEDLPEQIRIKSYIPVPIRIPLSGLLSVTEKVFARFYTAVVTVTSHIEQKFHRVNAKVVVVRNFPDASKFLEAEYRRPVPKFDFCYVGTLSEARGLGTMLEGVTSGGWSLALAGYFASDRDRTGFYNRSYVPGSVHFAGTLKPDQMFEFMGFAKCGLALLHPTSTYKYALPMKVFEYMAAGLPFIASDFPPVRELVDRYRCGLFVDPLNAKEVKAAMRWMLDNPDSGRRMGQAGRAAVLDGDLNWEAESKGLLALYHSLFPRP